LPGGDGEGWRDGSQGKRNHQPLRCLDESALPSEACDLPPGHWQLAARGRADLYEAKSLDGDALRAIAAALLDVTDTD